MRATLARVRTRVISGVAVLVAGVAVTTLPAPQAEAAPAGVLRTLDWETAADRSIPGAAPNGFVKQWTTGNGPDLVASPTRDGSAAARFQLDVADPLVSNGKRTEISQPDNQALNAERWYGFSVNLPTSWVHDTSAEIVSQWHQCDSGCPGGSPPLALLTDEGRWKVDFRGQIIDLGSYSTGKWTDWVFHVKWRTDNSGLVEVWRDGAPVLNRAGATHDGGPRSPYFKFGIYKWDWNKGKPTSTSQRVMYYDALRIGDARAAYDDVKPGQGAAPPSCTGQRLNAAGASANTSEPVNPPANAIDGNPATRWSGKGFGAALIVDLGSSRLVCGTKVGWHLGDQRWNDYTVYTSVDGVTYAKAWEGRSSGTTTTPEAVQFSGRNARYVKIAFWQNPQNDWASITEAQVIG
ncbi:heparin lyase I family protein [Streptomyces sp. ODS05-4]|uniref:heparin lyase I family protein n=1 Tax=Streptomyces sp. ODS05-4 TaxID=2944939 RepID=UPI00210938FE|nr:heparin lyase I family protein [Streptomyces sp. ODS05-4]